MTSTQSAGNGLGVPRGEIPPTERSRNLVQVTLAGLVLLAGLTACIGSRASPTPAAVTASSAIDLATPYAMEPAAGICGENEGPVAVVSLRPDVPDPRCRVVRSDQSLQILNAEDSARQVVFGRFQFEIAPGESYFLKDTFGSYLAPGVHILQVSPCCGPEILLKPD